MRYKYRLKFYQDQLYEISYSPDHVYSDGDNPSQTIKKHRKRADNAEADEKSTQKARSRARRDVFDLCACNPTLSYFVTLTIDEKRLDRYDYDIIIKKLNVWLDNNVRRRGLAYVMVAEYHKDKAIHFHALFNDALEIVDSGVKDKRGNVIYNLPSWTYGFTTAIKTYGDRDGAVKYITKYIGKSEDKVGGRWYYHGGKLNKPHYTYQNSVAPDLFERLPKHSTFNVDIGEKILSFETWRAEKIESEVVQCQSDLPTQKPMN